MSALPYHKRYHSDALAGFMPLTLEERGAYQTLLDMMYDRGAPLIDNERLLAGYMNCSIRKWRQIRDQLIEKGKVFITKDGLISNSRARKEIENQSKTQRKLIEAGAKGGRTRAENEKKPNVISGTGEASLEPALSDPQAIRASLPEARSHSVDKSTDADGVVNNPESPGFDPIKALFDDGVRVLGKSGIAEKSARSLIGRWRREYDDDSVALAIATAEARNISSPVEWIPKALASRQARSSGQSSGKSNDIVEIVLAEHGLDEHGRPRKSKS